MVKKQAPTDVVIAPEPQPAQPVSRPLARRQEFFDLSAKEQVRQASELADVLSDVVEKQKLFSSISGRKYIKAEGWQTLGCFLGITPKERSVVRHPDGSYEAYVELVKFADGTVVGGASAICSRSEKRWSSADDYAVRSMAVTRATGKAYRTSFAWIVTLAGYAPTPEEEMPRDDYQRTAQSPVQGASSKAKASGYQPHNPDHQAVMVKYLEKGEVPTSLWDDIGQRMAGKSFSELNAVIAEVKAASNTVEAEVVL